MTENASCCPTDSSRSTLTQLRCQTYTRRRLLVDCQIKIASMQFLSVVCGKSVILPCPRNAWHFGYEFRSRIPIPIKKLMHFLILIGITPGDVWQFQNG
jgi:hypothetical protein